MDLLPYLFFAATQWYIVSSSSLLLRRHQQSSIELTKERTKVRTGETNRFSSKATCKRRRLDLTMTEEDIHSNKSQLLTDSENSISLATCLAAIAGII